MIDTLNAWYAESKDDKSNGYSFVWRTLGALQTWDPNQAAELRRALYQHVREKTDLLGSAVLIITAENIVGTAEELESIAREGEPADEILAGLARLGYGPADDLIIARIQQGFAGAPATDEYLPVLVADLARTRREQSLEFAVESVQTVLPPAWMSVLREYAKIDSDLILDWVDRTKSVDEEKARTLAGMAGAHLHQAWVRRDLGDAVVENLLAKLR